MSFFIPLKKIFTSKIRIGIYFFLVGILGGIWWVFTDIQIMFGNYGNLHTGIDIFLSILMIILFPLFLIALWYRGDTLSGILKNKRTSLIGMAGGIMTTVISGSSCCGLTLASYFGLLPLMNILPYEGLELKIISVFGLIYALIQVLQYLETCLVKKV